MPKIKRIVIAKVRKGNEKKFVKYSYVNNLIAFTKFLNRSFDDWYFMNVFDRKTGNQIANFTKNNPPTYHP